MLLGIHYEWLQFDRVSDFVACIIILLRTMFIR